MEEFKTILNNASSIVEEKKSKFIGDIFYIEDTKQAEEIISKIKKKYFDAKHHCYAYRIIEQNGLKEKQSDDGEPSGTAGAPMLNVLQKNNLYNVLIVVTRYFGGTLLGTGGLIRAYSDTTLLAINKAEISLKKLGYEVEITLEYKELERFKYYCRKNKINIIKIKYEKDIICIIELDYEKMENLLKENKKDLQILKYAVLTQRYINTKIE